MQNFPSNFKTILSFFSITSLIVLMSACSQNVKPDGQTGKTPTKSATSKVTKPEPKVVYRHFPPDVMYKVMVAELLIKRDQASAAYPLMYSAAQESKDPGLAERAFQLSMTTFNLQAIEDATNLWREVEPNKALPWKASYLMSVRAGDINTAMAQWNHYKTLSGAPIESVLIETGLKVSQSADRAKGLEFLTKLKDTYPKEPASYFALGLASVNYGAYRQAIPVLEKSADLYQKGNGSTSSEDSIDPEKINREIYLLLATAYLKSSQPELGMEKVHPYLDDHEEDWELQEKFARLEVKAGRFADAEKRYLKVLEHEPKAFTSRLSVALLQLERKDYKDAISNLKQLRQLPEYRSTANYYLGLASQGQGEFKQAVKYYQSVKTTDYYLDAQLHIAEIRFPDVGLERTLEILNSLQARNDDQRVKLYRAQAIFYKLAGEKQKAINMYSAALQLQPENVTVLLSQAMIYYDLKQYKSYVSNIKRSLKVEPDNIEALNALAYFYVERNEHLDEAEKLLKKALTLAPDEYYILDSRGWLYYQQGKYEQAESDLKRAFSMEKDDEVLIHLIKVKWKLGKQDDAKNLWNQYHRNFPENTELQGLIIQLEK
ncbi:MAG: tetratricopeptide repeat protein [Thiotrichales bacterium]|nr:tetratricopeptide repeat protein [Thiotrichales bacterium]